MSRYLLPCGVGFALGAAMEFVFIKANLYEPIIKKKAEERAEVLDRYKELHLPAKVIKDMEPRASARYVAGAGATNEGVTAPGIFGLFAAKFERPSGARRSASSSARKLGKDGRRRVMSKIGKKKPLPSLGSYDTSVEPLLPPPASPAVAEELRFDDVKLAYGKQSTWHLLRALAVFTLCSSETIVAKSEDLLALSNKIFGKSLTEAVMRSTFFAHFCAGETGADIQPVVMRLKKAGVGSILDYAAENELEDLEEVAAEEDIDVVVRREARRGVVSARTYDYAGEAECDANADMFLQAIEDAAAGEGLVAVKLTALGKPVLLERMSSLLIAIRDLWHDRFALPSGEPDGSVSPDSFQLSLRDVGVQLSESQAAELFDEIDFSKDDKLDYIEWTYALRLNDLTTRSAAYLTAKDQFAKSGVLPLLDERETALMDNMVRRLETVAKAAAAARVRLMIDAEQTYLQPAIDHFTLELQRRHNIDFPSIFNTYQCYLKKTQRKVTNDLERSQREGFWFAGKMVRGAYMVQERARAEELGIEDPILPNIDATHANYDACVELILDNMDHSNVMVASHNEASVAATVAGMAERNIAKDSGVYFGQLLGMADYITFTLGSKGYRAFKYVPYGPIDEVMPYLIRRAQENSGMMSNVAHERAMLWAALKQRFSLSS
ncbi:proline dehydrogenase 1 [Thecamonas trahens ATCC 50062]|uniref:Proline dehydrogenase n=1 Tax=Thecamonas trahens ATCC 50062 TaxID=461836 RepID=A0A0L0DP30_THETB|nr:proline dehydrogenase 1 [Thecamonas trahens ATCC 50062]KNC54025.1 proline dehydrogenase 1 [Thecamonas trahens ATCC 50062]|eukprot:XP_013754039.1 proline dehydrogenase 1 [Thecamonas trahens ATCC 50062]